MSIAAACWSGLRERLVTLAILCKRSDILSLINRNHPLQPTPSWFLLGAFAYWAGLPKRQLFSIG